MVIKNNFFRKNISLKTNFSQVGTMVDDENSSGCGSSKTSTDEDSSENLQSITHESSSIETENSSENSSSSVTDEAYNIQLGAFIMKNVEPIQNLQLTTEEKPKHLKQAKKDVKSRSSKSEKNESKFRTKQEDNEKIFSKIQQINSNVVSIELTFEIKVTPDFFNINIFDKIINAIREKYLYHVYHVFYILDINFNTRENVMLPLISVNDTRNPVLLQKFEAKIFFVKPGDIIELSLILIDKKLYAENKFIISQIDLKNYSLKTHSNINIITIESETNKTKIDLNENNHRNVRILKVLQCDGFEKITCLGELVDIFSN